MPSALSPVTLFHNTLANPFQKSCHATQAPITPRLITKCWLWLETKACHCLQHASSRSAGNPFKRRVFRSRKLTVDLGNDDLSLPKGGHYPTFACRDTWWTLMKRCSDVIALEG